MNNALAVDLVSLARQGDQAAYEAVVFHPHEQAIYSFVYRMMGDAEEASDLTQDTFIKAYKALGRTSDDLNVSAWLHKIASNACLDVLRRRQRLRFVPWNGPVHDHRVLSSPLDEPERSTVSQETRTIVQRVLARVHPRHRVALILREYDGLSCEQIGETMGLSRTAVKSMLFRARQDFRRAYRIVTGEVIPTPQARATITRRRSGPWRPDEDAILRAGLAAGDPWKVIGQRVHRAGGCCYNRAVRLGLVVPVSVRKAVAG